GDEAVLMASGSYITSGATTGGRIDLLADLGIAVLLFLVGIKLDLKLVKAGHQRTVEDILNEQRSGSA
ncbi:MAG: hypothetical protein B7Z23_08145, partial [Pseudomonadales bacterium 32-61-5]